MYRSIATRLDQEGTKASGISNRDIVSSPAGPEMTDQEKDNQILAKLESWKDYVEKEEGIRKKIRIKTCEIDLTQA